MKKQAICKKCKHYYTDWIWTHRNCMDGSFWRLKEFCDANEKVFIYTHAVTGQKKKYIKNYKNRVCEVSNFEGNCKDFIRKTFWDKFKPSLNHRKENAIKKGSYIETKFIDEEETNEV